jgi:molybdopterin synthase sulfur carrier subunit
LQVSVRFFTRLREITGTREVSFKFTNEKPVTLEKVIKKLAELYGDVLVEYVYEGKTGEVKSFLQFLVNGRSVSSLNGLRTELSNGDVIAIIPPVGGG